MSACLITNDTTSGHSAQDMAEAAVSQIFTYNPNGGPGVIGGRGAGIRLQAAMMDVLIPHFQRVVAAEKAALQANADSRFAKGLIHDDLDPHLDVAVQAVVNAATGTPWEKQFAAPEMPDVIRAVLGNHLATAQHIHRQEHANANPDHPAGQAFMAMVHGRMAAMVHDVGAAPTEQGKE